jgi:transcriptional regulator with XRE-family HTH domain
MDGVNLELLVRHLTSRRAGRSLRKVASEIGLSASTLCRVEQGYIPDLVSFSKICRWLGTDPSIYLEQSRGKKLLSTERAQVADELAWMLSQFDLLSNRDFRTRLEDLERRICRGPSW